MELGLERRASHSNSRLMVQYLDQPIKLMPYMPESYQDLITML